MKQLTNYIKESFTSVNEALVKKHLNHHNILYIPDNRKELINCIVECFKNKNFDLNCIDTSRIQDMSALFYYIVNNEVYADDILWYELKLNGWDVSNVKDFNNMFNGCGQFDSDVKNWNIKNAKNTYYMFARCSSFNQDITNWDFSHIEKCEGMFFECSSLKQNFSKCKFNAEDFSENKFVFYNCPYVITPDNYK